LALELKKLMESSQKNTKINQKRSKRSKRSTNYWKDASRKM